MSGVERWELRASRHVHHRQKDCIGNVLWAWRGLGIGWRVIPPHPQKTLPKHNQNWITCKESEDVYFGCCFIVVSCWPELLLHGRSGRTEDSWVLREKSRPFLKCFCPVGFFLFSAYISLFLRCVERSKFVYENLVCEEKPFPLVCLVFINKTETRQKEGFFSPKEVYIVFIKANPRSSLTKWDSLTPKRRVLICFLQWNCWSI